MTQIVFRMFDISVLSRCSLIYDPLLERPFHKAFNGACFIFVRCITAKIIAFKNVSHDIQRTERVGGKMAAAKKAVKDCPKVKGDTTHANVLDEIEQEYENSVTGPKVEAHVAKTIKIRWETRMDIKILKDKMAKYSRPDNCVMIRVPHANTPVWKTLESHQRRNDVKITTIQKTRAALPASLANTFDMVCKDQMQAQMIQTHHKLYVMALSNGDAWSH